jgi:putative chitinase
MADQTGQAQGLPSQGSVAVGITLAQLLRVMPTARERAPLFLGYLQETLDRFEISATPLRVAHFLAQVAHESGELRYLRELWGPTSAQLGYEGRADLGNTEAGDGAKFKGRGLIQITGRANYAKVSQALYGDAQHLLDTPELLETKEAACLSAGWFWDAHHLNGLADQDQLEAITRRINGGTNGFADRAKYLAQAKEAFGV